jgi:uncharacterized membrane protein
MIKTLTFASLHFSIALTVAFILTGDFLLGSLIALIEPSVNTVAFYFHEKVWNLFPFLRRRQAKTQVKTASFAFIHFNVAFMVTYLITGDAFIGGVMAMIEPSINTIAYYFHEKVWLRRHAVIDINGTNREKWA